MELLRFLVCVLMLFGNTTTQSIRTYPIVQLDRRPNRVIQPYIPPSNARIYNPGPNILIRNPVTVKTWYNVGTTSPLPIIINRYNYLPKITPSSNAITTESVPETTTLNENLKSSTTFKDDNENMVTEKVTQNPSDSDDDTEPNDDGEQTSDKATIGGLIGVIIKKHFYFQVQPVTPESETDEEARETVYYVD